LYALLRRRGRTQLMGIRSKSPTTKGRRPLSCLVTRRQEDSQHKSGRPLREYDAEIYKTRIGGGGKLQLTDDNLTHDTVTAVDPSWGSPPW
jgi:hypothetical protein